MAKVITLARRSYANTKGIGAGRKNHHAIKDKQKPGIFWVDQFADWIMGFRNTEVAYPSNTRIETIKMPTRKK